jgi:hypothetical protein
MVSLRSLVQDNLIKRTNASKKYTINGKAEALPIYRIPLKYLYYNNQNGRISTVSQKYMSSHEDEVILPMSDCEDSGKVYDLKGGLKGSYNDLFEMFITDSNTDRLLQTKDSIKEKSQEEPGVVLDDGRVIDGNRRFTALRLIEKEEEVEQFFEAAILDFDIRNEVDKKTIKQLELDLQMGKESRVEYDPIDRVFDVYNTVCCEQIMSATEYARHIGHKDAKGVNQEIKEAKLISQFLEFINAPGSYYIAKEMKLDGPMNEVRKILGKKGLLEDGEVCSAAFSLLVLSYQNKSLENEQGDITRIVRSRLKELVNSSIKEDWVIGTEQNVDVIYDAFHSQPVENTQQISEILSKDETVIENVDQFERNSRLLEKKGSYKDELEHTVSMIVECADKLLEIDETVLGRLEEKQAKRAARSLQEIMNTARTEYQTISDTGNLL